MPGFLSKSHGEDLDFELFSNVVLKFTAILMVVLVLLAINVGQRLDQIISPYRFTGGLARPQLYLGAYAPENWINVDAKMSVSLYSASFFRAATFVDQNTGEVASRRETETFSGFYINQPYPMLGLLAGISPGAIPIEGKQTPFVVPNFSTKAMTYHDRAKNSRASPPSEQLARGFLQLWSGAYANPVYPTRALSEYKDVKTLIYVETRQGDFIIGDQVVRPAQIKAGWLDFLTSLSSTSTEVVYLGDVTEDFVGGKDPRLTFYEKNGFMDAAKHLRFRLFPEPNDLKLAQEFYDRLTPWNQLSLDAKAPWLKSAKGNANLARAQYELSIARQASANYRNSLVEDALEKNAKPDLYALPTSLAFPDAWRAYVEYRLKSAPTPPDWFITQLLRPLGFDNRVMVVDR